MDIMCGHCLALGGYCYGLLLVDVATCYSWFYGLASLAAGAIIGALKEFKADVGGVPRRFHSDFDNKLIGGRALKWILSNSNNIIPAPAKFQSSNGLVERTWQTVLKMACSHITGKNRSVASVGISL